MSHIKKFPDLGMNINSDKYLLPDHYTPIPEPYFTGKGNHTIDELETLLIDYKEYCHQQAIIKSELIKEIKSL